MSRFEKETMIGTMIDTMIIKWNSHRNSFHRKWGKFPQENKVERVINCNSQFPPPPLTSKNIFKHKFFIIGTCNNLSVNLLLGIQWQYYIYGKMQIKNSVHSRNEFGYFISIYTNRM